VGDVGGGGGGGRSEAWVGFSSTMVVGWSSERSNLYSEQFQKL